MEGLLLAAPGEPDTREPATEPATEPPADGGRGGPPRTPKKRHAYAKSGSAI